MRATIILGAGPGGTGPLIWAAQNGRLRGWLDAGVAIVERTASLGGTLGRYVANSDSLGTAYLECLDAPAGRALFAPLRDDPATRALAPLRYDFPPLALVARYLERQGVWLREIVAQHAASTVLTERDVCRLHLRRDGSVAAEIRAPNGTISFIEARTAVLALGGCQEDRADLARPLLPGVDLRAVAPEKLVPSDELLQAQGLRRAAAALARATEPRVVILGGSHSGFSAAWVLTTQPATAHHFGAGAIEIFQRRPPPVFYASRDAAIDDGYGFTERDLCPRTGRVNRLGGLRGNGRELWRRLTCRPETRPEERVRMVSLADPALSPAALRLRLETANLVIPAFGYRAVTVPVLDADGRRLALQADHGGPAVGDDGRLLLAGGGALPNVFGIGLGSGFRPWGAMGGGPSFRGQANGLWLYQNDIGGVIYQGIEACVKSPAPGSVFQAGRQPARPLV